MIWTGSQDGVSSRDRARCIVLALFLVVPPIAVALQAAPACASEPSQGSSSSRAHRWKSHQWTFRGETIVRGAGWLRIDRAVATHRTRDREWTLRADRVFVQVSLLDPHRLVAMRAEGRVRVIGPPPLYVTGAQALSFRPGRDLAVGNRSDRSELVGPDWSLRGTKITVDFEEARATISDIGPAASLIGRATAQLVVASPSAIEFSSLERE